MSCLVSDQILVKRRFYPQMHGKTVKQISGSYDTARFDTKYRCQRALDRVKQGVKQLAGLQATAVVTAAHRRLV